MPGSPRGPSVVSMESTQVTISLDLEVAGDRLTGRATDGHGTERDFLGWLGMVAAIDALLEPATDSQEDSQ